MRWDDLFADLEARADELDRSDRAVEIGESARIEAARLTIADRLATAVGTELHVRVSGAVAVNGQLRSSGPGWLLLDTGSGCECLVAIHAVTSIVGLNRWSAAPDAGHRAVVGLGIRHVLRAVASDRSSVVIQLVDGSGVCGTIDRVGRDFIDVALHGTGEIRRRDTVRASAVIPTHAVSTIRREV